MKRNHTAANVFGLIVLLAGAAAVAQIPPYGCPSGGNCDNPAPCGYSRCADNDNDGLCDAWERAGGIDLNGDGVIREKDDLPLPDANPHRPDIYLQYDYMVLPGRNGHSHRPHPQAIRAVVDAFARQGIALHAFPGHPLPHYTVVTYDYVDHMCSGDDAAYFYDLKARSFDPRKEVAYHYAIFAHYNTCGTAYQCGLCQSVTGFGGGGKAELPGNDSIISLGAFLDILGMAPEFEQEAGVLMHELGHNLGLRHGGDVDLPDFKPNYLSVMNDEFIYGGGIPVADGPGSTTPISCHVTADCPAEAICASLFSHTCRRLDYSRQVLPNLNEASLYESVGIGAWTNDLTSYSCPDFTTAALGAGTGPIDWNCNGNSTDANVAVDISLDSALTVLTGHQDWGALNFNFQCSRNRGEYPPVTPHHGHEERELSIPEAMGKHVLFSRRAVEAVVVAAEPGVLAIAILGADDLDTADINIPSVKLAGASAVRTRFADVDGDGRADLVLTFDATDKRLNAPVHPLHLNGWLENSQTFVAKVRP